MTRMDTFVEQNHVKVGLITMDVEGFGLRVVKGGIATIVAQRPMLSLAVYHAFDEFFWIPDLLRKHLPDYTYEIHLINYVSDVAYECVLIGLPNEI
jgi:hypothetical protein